MAARWCVPDHPQPLRWPPRLLATGATDREIARELAIAVGTVRAHVGRILLKLNVGSRTAAVALALRAQRPAGD